jgi:hypothetical protein
MKKGNGKRSLMKIVYSISFGIIVLGLSCWFLIGIDTEKIKEYGQRVGKTAGEALGKSLSEGLVGYFIPEKKGPEVEPDGKLSVDVAPVKIFIQDSFAGKMAEIPQGGIDDVLTVKLNKAIFNTTALMAAVAGRKNAVVHYLLERGANPDVPNEDGITALMYAAREGNHSLVDELLSFKANPNISDKHDMTPLMYAVTKNQDNDHGEVIKTLLQHHADPDAQNNKGETALMIAALKDDYDAAELLVEYGANTMIHNKYGRTAFDFTTDERLEELLSVNQFFFQPSF